MDINKEDIPVQCPCCKAVFMFSWNHPVHTRAQIELQLEQIREIHPEVNEMGDEEGG